MYTRLVIDAPIWAILELLWGYLATFGAKSDVIFLLGDPISYKGDEISRLSRRVFEIGCETDRRQTDRRDDRYRRLLHLQCASLIT